MEVGPCTVRFPRAAMMVRLTMVFLATAVLSSVALPPAHAAAGPYSALRDYIEAEDDAYEHTLVRSTASEEGYTAHLLRMTSQQWRAPGEARPLLWRHWLVVVVPDTVSKDTAALVVAGGSRVDGPPSFDDDEIRFGAQLAVLSETVVAVLTDVPYQPLAFSDEPFPHEDALVAYSWKKALETDDYSWPVYLPMAKAAVRAMDSVQDFVPSVAPGSIEHFVVVGASKRGAAAWLTAAADMRVKAVAPMVIEILNFSKQIEHHLAVYGTYLPAIADYVEYGLVQQVDTPSGEALRQVVDPYAYRDTLDMPKYIINSTGDQYFPPDSSQFYVGDLPGENLVRYVPNSDHSLSNSDAALIDAVSGLFGWYLAVVNDLPRPAISWQRDGGHLVVETSPPPLAVRLWQATNPEARDFRLGTIGEAWQHAGLAPLKQGTYAATVPQPTSGWTAYFVELVYPSPRPGLCQVYSTRVFVTPEIRPFEGADPRMAGEEFLQTGGDPTVAAARGDVEHASSSLFDEIFQAAAGDVHEAALDEAFDEGIEDRAIRHCFPRHVDDIDEALELYARLGFGRSVDSVLEDLWDQARDEAGKVVDDVDAAIDDGIDEAGNFIDDGAQEAADFVDDVF